MLILLSNLVFKRDKFFDVINVCCCCCLILLFVLTRFLNIDILQHSNASIFTPLSYLRIYLSVHTEFFEKELDFFGIRKKYFWVFPSVSHLVDNYAKIVDGRGRNLMCHRTLPSRLVHFIFSNMFLNAYRIFVQMCRRETLTTF